MKRFIVVLDTGAGSSFIHTSALSTDLQKLIQPLGSDINVRDANNRRVLIVGTMNLTVQAGSRIEIVKFNVVERLGTDVILGCDFCDKHAESIRPRKLIIDLANGTAVPILKRPESR